jgi:tetratricopeptide (TPR) repeat protein
MRSEVQSSKFKVQSSKFAFVLLWSLIFGLWASLNAQSVNQLYTSANSLYKQNQFEQAAAAYEKILAQGYRTPEVYYNLGNSYYKQGNTGKAILNFERAKKLSPEDEDIAHNLKLTQLKTADRIVPVPQLALTAAWNSFISSQSSKGWSYFALGYIWFTLLLFAIYLFIAKKRFVFVLGFLFFLISIVSVSLAFKQSNTEENSDFAILLVENVNVKSAPDINGTDLFTIHEGIKFQILDVVGSWNKIRLADGKVGWIEKNLFEKI